ncbi:MAG: hypothetical protein KDF60_11515 [Calditrichaeota bacterium]|nr:hypothetical protein [Calditrichota bacterium]
MSVNEKKLEDLKQKLYRLHFLLTEQQNEETKVAGINQFVTCFSSMIDNLKDFLTTEYGINVTDDKDVVENSFEYNLFNENTLVEMRNMLQAKENAEKNQKNFIIYEEIQNNYARLIQMIHDLLKRMGEEATDDDND